MIYLNSRYTTGEVVFIRDPKTGNTIPTVFRDVRPPNSYYSVYKWRDGDRADTVGKMVEGKANQWWRVFDKNYEYIDPLAVPHGASVVVQ